MPQTQKFKNAKIAPDSLPSARKTESTTVNQREETWTELDADSWHFTKAKPRLITRRNKVLVNQAINRHDGWANVFGIVDLFLDISKLFYFCVSCDRELLVKMATDSDQESEVSFATNSTVDEDVAWPSNSAARAPEQISLEHGDQKDFEKFVKKKHEQVSRRLICTNSFSSTRETAFSRSKKTRKVSGEWSI